MTLKYRPEIDGVRAVAVLGVLIYHAQFAFGGQHLLAGGFVGVDVFFVISGFLITKILLTELEQREFSLWKFYERRIRRILPALLTVIVASAPFAFVLLMPKAMREYALSVLSTFAFGSNFYFLFQDSYFAEASNVTPFLHTWSLAVEEQYYLFFPLLLGFLWKRARPFLAGALITIAIASLMWAQFTSVKHAQVAFYSPLTRVWELFAGSILATLKFEKAVMREGRLAGALSSCGLAAIFGAMIFFQKETPHPSLFTLAPVLGTVLVIAFTTKGTWPYRILASKPFVAVGRISYSLYLWHCPVFAFARIWRGDLSAFDKVSLIALSIALSTLSYIFVEKPFRNRARITTRVALSSVGLSVVAASAIAFFGFYEPGFVKYRIKADPFFAAVQHADERGLLYENSTCRFHTETFEDGMEPQLLECIKTHDEAFLILGDSHAIDVFNMMSEARPNDMLVSFAMGDCLTVFPDEGGTDECRYNALRKFLSRSKAANLTILYVQAGHHLFDTNGRGVGGRWLFEGVPNVPLYGANLSYIDHISSVLAQFSASSKVIWIGPRIEPYLSLDNVLAHGCKKPFSLAQNVSENFRQLDRRIAERVASQPFSYLSEQDAVHLDPSRDIANCDEIFFSDVDHYSPAGEKRFASRISTALRSGNLISSAQCAGVGLATAGINPATGSIQDENPGADVYFAYMAKLESAGAEFAQRSKGAQEAAASWLTKTPSDRADGLAQCRAALQ